MKRKDKENIDATEQVDEKIELSETEASEKETEKNNTQTQTDDADNIDEVEQLKTNCEQSQKQVEEYKDRLLRLQADFENFKKRNQREKADIINRASEGLVTDLLPALDNFDRALGVEIDENSKSLYEGVEMVYNQILEVLKNNGLEEIECLNEKFDPNSHHAVVQQESDEHDADTVMQVLAKGYKYKDKVIRHSTVMVSK